MKRMILLVATVSTVLLGFAQNKSRPATKSVSSKPVTSKSDIAMKSAIDSFSYAIGMSVGKFYKQQGLTSIKSSLMLKGINDAMSNSGKPLMDEMQCNQVVQTYIGQIKSRHAAGAKMAGQKFLDSVAKQPGVVKLSNGLQYKVIKAGTDTVHPKETDVVKFHYVGKLSDGTEFDNSYKRGEPLTHPVNQLIPGWTQALQMMTPGSKWILYIPSDLGYGDNGAGEIIPPGAVLVFEVELLDIVKK